MLRSKEQLIESHPQIEHEAMDELMSGLGDTAEKMKALAKMVETAYIRILVNQPSRSQQDAS